MKAIRLVVRQSSANYKKEETVDNKMTYPLPPFSTVIGAIHSACGYRTYHPMDISIQGKYESMHREPYTDYCFLNSVQDDRGILVKMKNGDLISNAFEKVASAKKSQGNSFRGNVTIQIHNPELLKEYRELKDFNDRMGEWKKIRMTRMSNMVKKRRQTLKEKMKGLTDGCREYHSAVKREKEIREQEKQLRQKVEDFYNRQYKIPISYYRTLVTSVKYYEVLNNIELILHIRAEEEVLADILEHAYEIKSIGRSEDTIQVEDASLVELKEGLPFEAESRYSAYISYEQLISDEEGNPPQIFIKKRKEGKYVRGTLYRMNKNYRLVEGRREFEKKKVVYVSHYAADETSKDVFWDEERGYLVNFV